MHIKPTQLSDSHLLVPLIAQLGYPSSESDIRERLKRTEGNEDYASWVAENASNHLTGFAAGQIYYPYELNDPIVRLVALVVDENSRGHNLGKQLVNVVAKWAVSKGAVHIALTSSNRRKDAHKFYEHIGFTASGTRFGMDLKLRNQTLSNRQFLFNANDECLNRHRVTFA